MPEKSNDVYLLTLSNADEEDVETVRESIEDVLEFEGVGGSVVIVGDEVEPVSVDEIADVLAGKMEITVDSEQD